ncbi:MAG: hypothetical protein AAF696_31820, partial [Bacteroidota bacterium]
MRFLKKIWISLLLLSLLLLILFNLGLYHSPTYQNYSSQKFNQDFVHQLNFLQKEIHGGSAKEMQKIYPEGFVFQHALYALSWIELFAELSPEDSLYRRAEEEINWSLKALSSEDGKRIFQHVKVPRYGIFYIGWVNYIRARYLRILPDSQQHDSL